MDLLENKKFNMITVLHEDFSYPKQSGKEARYICKCDCGKIFTCKKSSIVHEKSYSCGCKKRLYNDFTNSRFGKLLALKPMGLNSHREMTWLCRCDCGKETITNAYSLKTGMTKSCGCLRTAKRINAMCYKENYKHLHEIYTNMKTRCYNDKTEQYENYGGRGIIVCDEWLNSFKMFYDWAISNGYNKNLTLDRQNNDSNYNPNNCRWVNKTVQANNRRTNKILTVGKISDTMANWSRKSGTEYYKIQRRLKKGYSDIDAIYGKE